MSDPALLETCERCLEGSHRRCKGRRRCACGICARSRRTRLSGPPERTQSKRGGNPNPVGNKYGGPGRRRSHKPPVHQWVAYLNAQGLTHREIAHAFQWPSRYTTQSILRQVRNDVGNPTERLRRPEAA